MTKSSRIIRRPHRVHTSTQATSRLTRSRGSDGRYTKTITSASRIKGLANAITAGKGPLYLRAMEVQYDGDFSVIREIVMSKLDAGLVSQFLKQEQLQSLAPAASSSAQKCAVSASILRPETATSTPHAADDAVETGSSSSLVPVTIEPGAEQNLPSPDEITTGKKRCSDGSRSDGSSSDSDHSIFSSAFSASDPVPQLQADATYPSRDLHSPIQFNDLVPTPSFEASQQAHVTSDRIPPPFTNIFSSHCSHPPPCGKLAPSQANPIPPTFLLDDMHCMKDDEWTLQYPSDEELPDIQALLGDNDISVLLTDDGITVSLEDNQETHNTSIKTDSAFSSTPLGSSSTRLISAVGEVMMADIFGGECLEDAEGLVDVKLEDKDAVEDFESMKGLKATNADDGELQYKQRRH